MYFTIQILCMFCAFICLGRSSGNVSKFDKLTGTSFCIVFIAIILYIEGALK